MNPSYLFDFTSALHMISAMWPSNCANFVPNILLKWSLACFHALLMWFEWISTFSPVSLLTYDFLKANLCTTVKCWNLRLLRGQYADQPPLLMALPGEQSLWIMGSKVSSDRSATGYNIKVLVSRSTIPKTHIWIN